MNKKHLLYIVVIGLIFSLSSCEDDRSPILKLKKAAEFNALAQSEFIFSSENATDQFPVISWKAVDYGVSAAINYIVTLTNKTNNKSIVIGETTGTELSFTYGEINSLLAKVEGYPNQTYDIEISLKSTAYDYVADPASNTINFRAQPYDPKAVDWPFAYVAKNFPDWDYTTAFMLGDPNEDGIYEGYAYFEEDGQKFALVDGLNTATVLAQNQKVDAKGFYKITIDQNKNVTISNPFTWAIIGSATSGGWGADTQMEYNPDTRIWTSTVPLMEGEFKFRGNGDWSYNYGTLPGKNTELSGDLIEGGDNIQILKSSPYIIKLNLTNAGKYTYSLEETTIELSSATMYMPGSYQNWAPGDASCYTLTSQARDFKYVGYYYIPANTEFKFLDGSSWGATEYALPKGSSIIWNSDYTLGTFSVASSDNENIKIDYANFYKISLDTKKLTCEFKKTGWEIIGSATSGGWDKGTLMSYDPETKLWSATVTLSDGEFKFRWDGAWDKNFGGSLSALSQDGANISVSAGTYLIVLDETAKKATMSKK